MSFELGRPGHQHPAIDEAAVFAGEGYEGHFAEVLDPDKEKMGGTLGCKDLIGSVLHKSS